MIPSYNFLLRGTANIRLFPILGFLKVNYKN